MTPITPKTFIKAIQTILPLLKEDSIPNDLEYTLKCILSGNHQVIDRERFNIILSSFHIAPCSPQLFRYYFKDKISSIEDFIDNMRRFMKDALWYYGDIGGAYSAFNKINSIEEFVKSNEFDI